MASVLKSFGLFAVLLAFLIAMSGRTFMSFFTDNLSLFGMFAGLFRCKSVHISMENKIINETDERFVSMTIDMGQLAQSGADGNVNVTNEQLIYLASQLSPSILRVGGTQSDYTYYEVGKENPCKLPTNTKNPYHCYSMNDFDDLISFAHSIGADLVFSLSMGYPLYPSDGSIAEWNSSNTESFLSYLIETKHYSANDIYGFELGNEVNQGKPYNTANVQSNAFKKLHKILQSLSRNETGKFALFGPDIHSYTLRKGESDFNYLPHFAEFACSVIDGLTYHCYVNQDESQLLTPNGLNEQYRESLRVSNIFNDGSICPKLRKNIIAGEIANHNMPMDTYLAGFWYLDALGTLSNLGHSIFARQTLAKSNYGFLDNDYNPHTDYFVALLFNDLMSNKAVSVSSNDEYFRIYAHCAKNYSMSVAVALAFININNESVNVTFDKGLTAHSGDVYLYLLTPFNLTNGLHSKTMALNGNELKLDSNGKLPNMNGEKVNVENGIIIQKQCYGFFVFSNTSIDVCS